MRTYDNKQELSVSPSPSPPILSHFACERYMHPQSFGRNKDYDTETYLPRKNFATCLQTMKGMV